MSWTLSGLSVNAGADGWDESSVVDAAFGLELVEVGR